MDYGATCATKSLQLETLTSVSISTSLAGRVATYKKKIRKLVSLKLVGIS